VTAVGLVNDTTLQKGIDRACVAGRFREDELGDAVRVSAAATFRSPDALAYQRNRD